MNEQLTAPQRRCRHCRGILKEDETGKYCVHCMRLPAETREEYE